VDGGVEGEAGVAGAFAAGGADVVGCSFVTD
jgi:hypothetical protein